MITSNPKVSVIIPVYNTSKYLRKCLDSLSKQTLKNIEFILVDDGSTDDSGSICDEFTNRDTRFKVIHKKNGGSASARQSGLDISKGEYVIVCDSDDWTEPEMYEILYNEAKKRDADIVCCDYYVEYSDGRSIPLVKKFKIDHDNIVDNLDYTYHGASNSWTQLIRRSFFVNNNISYDPLVSLGEDALITLKLMRYDPKIVKINKFLYHYRRLFGEISYTNCITNKSLQQLYYKFNWIKANYSEEYYNDMVYRYALSIVFSSYRSKDIDLEQFYSFLKNEMTWKSIVSHKKSLKSLIVVLSKIFPYKFVRSIIRPLYPLFYK